MRLRLLRVDQFSRQPYAQRKLNDFGGLEGKSKKADPTFVALDIEEAFSHLLSAARVQIDG